MLFTAQEAYALIDPIIGTSSKTQGNVVPAASTPFGNVLLVPETRGGAPKCIAPYYYEDTVLRGVRWSHWISGSCTQDYGSFTVRPHMVELSEEVLQRGQELPALKSSEYMHRDLAVEPAKVEVDNLFAGRMNLSFTAMSHSALIRLSSAKISSDTRVVLRVVANMRGKYSAVNSPRFEAILTREGVVVRGGNPVTKLYLGYGQPAGFSGHLHMVIPIIPLEFGFLFGSKRVKCMPEMSTPCTPNANLSASVKPEFYAIFDPGSPLQLRGGVSFVSSKKAEDNMLKEVGKMGFDFNKVLAFAREKWQAQVGKVLVSNENQDRASSFYSAIYRSMLLPREFSDVDGAYPGFANTPLQYADEGKIFFNDFSAWDTFRALHPLQTLLNPQLSEQFARSLISMGERGGFLPIFPAWNSYTDEMIGDHTSAILGDFILKGILTRDDTEKAYKLMRQNAMVQPANEDYEQGRGRRCIGEYMARGYVPLECIDLALHRWQQSSRTIEYSLDDAVVAAVACKFGKGYENDCAQLRKRSENYQNVMDPAYGFVNGRYRNGSFITDFVDPKKRALFLTEGTPWQWTFAPMHDILGVAKALRISQTTLLSRIRTFFREDLDDHGNEPGHHVPFLFNVLKAYSDTQKVVHQIVESQYNVGATGLQGNDDCGQMSAWLVLSMLGMYQISPHRPVFQLTTPYFKEAQMNFENGEELRIKSSLPAAPFSKRVGFNGKCLLHSELSYRQIMEGGVLSFEVSHQQPSHPTFSTEACFSVQRGLYNTEQ